MYISAFDSHTCSQPKVTRFLYLRTRAVTARAFPARPRDVPVLVRRVVIPAGRGMGRLLGTHPQQRGERQPRPVAKIDACSGFL